GLRDRDRTAADEHRQRLGARPADAGRPGRRRPRARPGGGGRLSRDDVRSERTKERSAWMDQNGMGMVVMVLMVFGLGGLVLLVGGRHRKRSGRSPGASRGREK